MSIALLPVAGCGGGGGGDELEPEFMRVIHGATDFEALEVSVLLEQSSSSSAPAAKEASDPRVVPFGGVLDYFGVPEGAAIVRVRETDEVFPELELAQTIEPGSQQTLLLTTVDKALTGTFIADDTQDPQEGQFRIRVINATDRALDGHIAFAGADFDDASAFSEGTASGGASEYRGIDAGKYRLFITAEGSSEVLAEADDLELQEGRSYSLAIVGEYQVRLLRDR